VNQVSKLAVLPTEVVYRVLPKLQETGLVEKVVSSPAKFQATPWRWGIELLLERKKREDNDMMIKAREIMADDVAQDALVSSEEPKLVMIPERERLIQFLQERLLALEHSLSIVVTGQKFMGWTQTHGRFIRDVLGRGVLVRLLISGNGEARSAGLSEGLLNFENFNVKFTEKDMPACVGIFDEREAMMSTVVCTGFARSPIYWSNNPSMVAVCMAYFEKFWNGQIESKTLVHNIRRHSSKSSEILLPQ
jgi:sugar-specific transcriptional regulator TrmB